MKQKYIQFGLKLFAIISLFSIGAFAQNDWRNNRNNLSGVRWELTEINGRRINSSKAFIEINQNAK